MLLAANERERGSASRLLIGHGRLGAPASLITKVSIGKVDNLIIPEEVL